MRRGLGAAFATVYIPTLLFLSPVKPLSFPFFNETNCANAVIYGLCAGVCFGGRMPFTIRWNTVDTLVLLCAVAGIVTSLKTEYLYTGVSMAKAEVLGWLLPYIFARTSFHSAEVRRLVMRVLIVCLPILAVIAFIQFRFFPREYLLVFSWLGLFDWHEFPGLDLVRYGFFRSFGTTSHPIFFGNLCLVLGGTLGVLAGSVEGGWRIRGVWIAFGCVAVGIIFSLSHSPWVGFCVAAFLFACAYGLKGTRRFLAIYAIAAICIGFWASNRLLQIDTTRDPSDSAAESSLKVRALIMQHSWNMIAHSGLWGWGRLINQNDLDLSSVDNAYLVVGLTRGWVSLCLWLLLPIAAALRLSKALRPSQEVTFQASVIVGFAAFIGTMAAMFTVWQDPSFVTPWLILLGFTISLVERAPQAIEVPRRKALGGHLENVRDSLRPALS